MLPRSITSSTLPRQAHILARPSCRWKSTKTAHRPKVVANRKLIQPHATKIPRHDSIPSHIAGSTSVPLATPTYVGNQERARPIDKSIIFYRLKTARGLTATTYITTIFFSGTAVMTFQNYAVMAASQPFIYYIGSGLSLMWAGIAGYCFYAPLRMVSTITQLPNDKYANLAGEQQQMLKIGFHQTLPFVNYKPLVVAADDVGTDVPILPFHQQLKELEVESGGTNWVRQLYRTFIKMFARNTMVYLSIAGNGIWKVDLDPATSTLNEHDGRLSRAVRQRDYRPWWRKS